MREFQIDQAAERALSSGENVIVLPREMNAQDLETVRQRIMEAPFDCTPNWGIQGVGTVQNDAKRNWYTCDERVKARAQERLNNINFGTLHELITDATIDILSSDSQVFGFGVYGSYLYRESTHPPEDLDVFVIADGVEGVALDALRYRHPRLLEAFVDRALPTPYTNDLGLTIISREQFTAHNRSFIVTDAALLDVSTTYSHGAQVRAPAPSPFVLAHNALKLVNWGLSSLPRKPNSTMSRIDEALRMREMMRANNPLFGLQKFDIDEYLPKASRMLAGPDEWHLLEASKIIIRILEHDERKIREVTADNLRAAR